MSFKMKKRGWLDVPGLKCKDSATCKNFLLGTPGPAILNFYPQIQ